MMNVDEYKLPLKKVIEEFELEKIYDNQYRRKQTGTSNGGIFRLF